MGLGVSRGEVVGSSSAQLDKVIFPRRGIGIIVVVPKRTRFFAFDGSPCGILFKTVLFPSGGGKGAVPLQASDRSTVIEQMYYREKDGEMGRASSGVAEVQCERLVRGEGIPSAMEPTIHEGDRGAPSPLHR